MDSKPAVDNVKWTRGGRYIATTFRHVIPTLEPGDQGDRGIILELQTDLREEFTIMDEDTIIYHTMLNGHLNTVNRHEIGKLMQRSWDGWFG